MFEGLRNLLAAAGHGVEQGAHNAIGNGTHGINDIAKALMGHAVIPGGAPMHQTVLPGGAVGGKELKAQPMGQDNPQTAAYNQDVNEYNRVGTANLRNFQGLSVAPSPNLQNLLMSNPNQDALGLQGSYNNPFGNNLNQMEELQSWNDIQNGDGASTIHQPIQGSYNTLNHSALSQLLGR